MQDCNIVNVTNMLNGTHFHLEFNIDIASIYLEIPVNTAQSPNFHSCDWRPALWTDDSSISHFDILLLQNQEQYQWKTKCKVLGR